MRAAIVTPSNEAWRLYEPNNEPDDGSTHTVSHRAPGSKHTAAAACIEQFVAGGDVDGTERNGPPWA